MRSTIDPKYTLLSILKQQKGQHKDTYVDSAHAIDCVPYDLFSLKLLQHGIDGKIYRSKCSLYTDMQKVIKLNGYLTESLPVQTGVCKGDNLSPTLFSLYLNDLVKHVTAYTWGSTMGTLMLACADDLILIAESEENLHTMLNSLHE